MKSALDTYIGRQPVLDRGWNVAGYELLFRSSLENFCDAADGSAATSQVIVNAVLGVGLDRLLGANPPSSISTGRCFWGTGPQCCRPTR